MLQVYLASVIFTHYPYNEQALENYFAFFD